MCLAIPGKLIKLENGKAVIDYNGQKVEAIAKGIDLKLGDYVLVQMGIVIEKLESMSAD